MSNIGSIIKSIQTIMWQDIGLNGDAQRIEQLGWMLFLKIFSDKDKELELLDDKYKSPIPNKFHWVKEKGNWAGDDEGMTGDELLEFIDRQLFPALRNLDLSTGNQRAVIVREVFEGNNNYMKSGINIRKVLNKLNEIDFNVAKDRHAFGELYETILKELQSAGKSGEFYTPRAITQFITEIINPQIGEKVLDPASGTGGYLTCAIEHLKKQAKNIEERKSIEENIEGWEYKPLPYLLATTNLILHDIEIPNIKFGDALDQPLSTFTEKHRKDVILANPPFGGIVANGNENNFPQIYRTKESADLFLILMIHLLKDGGRAGIVLPDPSLTGDGVKQRVREKLLTECNLHTIIRLPNSVFQPYAIVHTNLLFFEKGKPTKEVWFYEHRLPEGYKAYNKTRPIRIEEFESIRKWWNKREVNEVAWKVSIDTIIERGYDLDIKNPTVIVDEIQNIDNAVLNQNEKEILLNNYLKEFNEGLESLNKSSEIQNITHNLKSIINVNTVIEDINTFIFKLAFRGKLLKQNPQDEPASELFKRINEEKKNLTKKEKAVAQITEDEYPYLLPKNWVWCKLKNVLTYSKGKKPKNLSKNKDLKYSIPYIDIAAFEKKIILQYTDGQNCLNCNEENILMVWDGARMGLVGTNATGAVGSTLVRITHFEVDKKYLLYFLKMNYTYFNKNPKQKGLPHLNGALFDNTPFPLAPLPEQKRIVQEIENQLIKTKQLKEFIENYQKANQQLLKSLIHKSFD
jgi:type I restriction enzyme M protein